jgi:hypothetical protein
MDSHGPIDREASIHGQRWGTLHGGYFSSVQVAAPLIAAVERAMPTDGARTLTDLGGGTGFLLSHFSGEGLRRVNVDLSAEQLEACADRDIVRVHSGAGDVTREQLTENSDTLTLMMRSVLHYAGAEGVPPMLSHLRAQLQPGEAFIHQTACFDDPRDAACLNQLYTLMRSPKCYPTVADLSAQLATTGFDVTAIADATALPLTASDLAERYSLTATDLTTIRTELATTFGSIPGVFESNSDTFTAHLHYRIVTCRAV